jgi:hypothetical protein
LNRWIRGLAWGGILFFGLGALFTTWFDATTWPFVVASLACVALLLWSWVRRRRLRATLPKGLRGLWYRTDRGRVEFHWRWASEPERLRILRSERATIRRANDDGLPGVARVVDAHNETYAADDGLVPGVSCRYAFFIGYVDGRWSKPVRQTITALPADDLAHLEATQRPLPWNQHPAGGPSQSCRAWDGPTGFFEAGVALEAASALAAVAIDAFVDGVFDLLEDMPPDKLAREGWVEVV